MFILPAFGSALAVLLLVAHSATAQSATGTVTGRVLWGPCVRGIPLPMTPNGQVAPDAQTQPAPGAIPQPAPVSGLPAGAVLVAAQNTAVSARTDEAGRFTLSGVPAGVYFTIAAGPVANASEAIAERPNVMLSGGQTIDVGTLSLGGSPTVGFPCRVLAPGVLDAVPGADVNAPEPGTTPSGGATTP
ncbi:MAG TPA: hypothetical protein VF937_18265 [Chloroflexota bacterium]